ncbi:MAG: tail fiber protein, partial [Xanthomonadales bacterium]|nr:tail fiber protein [Xanthomonadales bacterium]
IGATYGGNGQTEFSLPDLRGRSPVHVGNSGSDVISLGQRTGSESHTLSLAELPAHSHATRARNQPASGRDPMNQVLGQAPNLYRDADSLVDSRSGTVMSAGGSQAHNNMQPFLALNMIIALQGLFPSRD